MQTYSLALRSTFSQQWETRPSIQANRPRLVTVSPEPTPAASRAASPVVFVVDDDPLARKSLACLLDRESWRCETFASAEAFLSRPPAAVPSCAILEVDLPDLNGLELQSRIAARGGETTVIFASKIDAAPVGVRAMKAGAVDFLTKPIDERSLTESVTRAIAQSTAALRLRAEMSVLRARYASLSRREREVMDLIVGGLLNKQVGGELGISDVTVKAHRGQVMKKMVAASFADLVKMSIRLCPASPQEGPSVRIGT